MSANQDKMRNLYILTIAPDAEETATLVHRMTNTIYLGISGRGRPVFAPFQGWEMKYMAFTLQIRKLFFRQLDLPDEPEKIVDMLQLPQLKCLRTRGCRNYAPITALDGARICQRFTSATTIREKRRKKTRTLSPGGNYLKQRRTSFYARSYDRCR